MAAKVIQKIDIKLEKVRKICIYELATEEDVIKITVDENDNPIFTGRDAEKEKALYNDCINNEKYGHIFTEEQEMNYTKGKAICECGKEIELYDDIAGRCQCKNCGLWHTIFGDTVGDPNEDLDEDELEDEYEED